MKIASEKFKTNLIKNISDNNNIHDDNTLICNQHYGFY